MKLSKYKLGCFRDGTIVKQCSKNKSQAEFHDKVTGAVLLTVRWKMDVVYNVAATCSTHLVEQ